MLRRNGYILGCIAGALLTGLALLVIDEVEPKGRGALFVLLFGPIGALWFIRLIGAFWIAVLIWIAVNEVQSNKRIDKRIRHSLLLDVARRSDKRPD